MHATARSDHAGEAPRQRTGLRAQAAALTLTLLLALAAAPLQAGERGAEPQAGQARSPAKTEAHAPSKRAANPQAKKPPPAGARHDAPARRKAPPAAKAAGRSRAAATASKTAVRAHAGTAAAPQAAGSFADRPEVAAFVREMSERHGFDERRLSDAFARVHRNDAVLRLIAPPAPGFKRSWEAYRNRFLDPLRIREGLRFWQEHEAALRRAHEAWRVPPEIVVAIIGVETIYGRITGDFRVLEALATLAFDYPRRADFFRSELEQFLLHARDQGHDPLATRGSFAGAIGLPQFMPGSIRRYATDFDGDGRIDLAASPVDAIGSVARFLAEHGWVGGEPTHFDATIADASRLAPLIEAGIEPRFTAAQLAEHGVGSPQAVPPEMLLALIDLPNADKPASYYLGPRNFYVITRYNRSSFYAMAVIELSRVLAAER